MLIRNSNDRFFFEIRRDNQENILLQISEISMEENTRNLKVDLLISDELDNYFSNWMRGVFAWIDRSDSLNSLLNAKIIITDLLSLNTYEFNNVILIGYDKYYQDPGIIKASLGFSYSSYRISTPMTQANESLDKQESELDQITAELTEWLENPFLSLEKQQRGELKYLN